MQNNVFKSLFLLFASSALFSAQMTQEDSGWPREGTILAGFGIKGTFSPMGFLGDITNKSAALGVYMEIRQPKKTIGLRHAQKWALICGASTSTDGEVRGMVSI